MLFDAATGLLHSNPAAEQMLGLPPVTSIEAIGEIGLSVFDDEGRLLRQDEFPLIRALRENRAIEAVVEFRRSDDPSLWVLGRAAPTSFRGGPAVVATFADISAQRSAELALRESESRLQAILDATPAAIYVKDLDGRFTLVNRTLEELAHRSRAELVGATDVDVVGQAVASELRANDRAVLRGGEPVTFVEQVPRDGVRTSWVSVKFPLRTADGQIYGLAGISTDITEQTRALEAAAQLTTILEATGLAVLTFDLEGRVTSWGHAVEILTGVPAEAALGEPMPLLARRAESDLADQMDDIVAAVRAGRRIERETTLGGRGGRHVFVRASFVPILDHDGAVTGGAVVGRDATAERAAEAERTRLQRDLDHLQRLESLGQLAGGVAHDFNNLLAAVSLTAETLVRALPEGGPERRAAEQILNIAGRGVALTRQMLVFARRESHERAVVDLNEVVRRADHLLARTLGEQVRRELDLSPLPAPVEGDPVQLEQVVVNLALNARDAMPAGGTLRIATARVVLDEPDLVRFGGIAKPGEYVALTVADDGHGMDRQTLTQAMEPFFTTKPTGQGTGLGLSMVHGVASQARGGVVIYSEPARGTTVRVFLPLSPASVSAGPVPEADLPGRGRGEHVLVVEDAAELRSLVEHLLVDAGYDVSAVADGHRALLEAGVRWPDLVVTDVVMPGLTGPELAARLRASDPATKVLLISGYRGGQVLAVGDAVTDTLLEKPFTGDQLLRAVRDVLDRPRR